MILSLLRFFAGTVRVEFDSYKSERLFNLLALKKINFWNIENRGEKIRITLTKKGFKMLPLLAETAGVKTSVVKKTGFPFFMQKIKKRAVLIAGVFFFIFTVYFMSGFIWSISVDGNETISSDEIIYALEQRGFKTGVMSGKFDYRTLCDEIRLDMPQLMWIAINVKGSKAEVSVRERVEMPEMVDISSPSDIVAAKDGIIIKSEIADGTILTPVESVVREGQLCVSGIIESETAGRRTVAARGRLFARTETKIISESPENVAKNEYTGREKTRRTLRLFDTELNLFFKSSIPYENYDKIASIKELCIGGNLYLPVAIKTERFLEYTPGLEPLGYEQQLHICRERRNELFAAKYPGAVIEEVFEDVKSENGKMILESTVVAVEDIAVRVPLDLQRLAPPPETE